MYHLISYLQKIKYLLLLLLLLSAYTHWNQFTPTHIQLCINRKTCRQAIKG